jgi:formylglycine-generating enzyme required for sulfatase activity
VSFYDAALFCRWLGARLPSEAEWEGACRAGTETQYWSGDGEEAFERVGWLDLHRVGEKPANALGLYDVHGNVDEWCQDLWHDDYDGAPVDGSAWEEGGDRGRVVRGGSWYDPPALCRSAFRFRGHPSHRVGWLGFRPARFTTG